MMQLNFLGLGFALRIKFAKANLEEVESLRR
jgi:hypothetical protein